MLTENEIQWLEDRETQAKRDKGQYYCWYCKHHGYCDPLTLCPTGNSESGYRDATKFEARVAAKLADAHWHSSESVKPYTSHLHRVVTPGERLRIARIEVEKEMEDDI